MVRPGGATELEAPGAADAWRSLLRHAGLPFLELDAQGKVTSWSKQAAQALGAREEGAAGQQLEAIVAHKHKAQVSQALKRAKSTPSGDARPSAAKLPGAVGGKDASLNLLPYHSSAGGVVGVVGIVHSSGDGKGLGAPLPSPVSGVNAWRCTLSTSSAMPSAFELAEAKAVNGENNIGNSGETFREVVEGAVREWASPAEGDGGQVSFESDVMTFESQQGETRYFCVRGVATGGPELPFGGRIGMAEGYVVDVTSSELALQQATRWHERWRGLGHLVFDFALLVDITEYRILHVWDESSVFDEKLEGRSLMNYVEGPEDRSVMSDAFSAALVAQAGTQQPLVFWNARRQERIFTRCAMVSDGGDPSVIFIGASLIADTDDQLNDPEADSAMRRRAQESASSSDVVTAARLMMLGNVGMQDPGPREQLKAPAPELASSKPPAPPMSLGAAPLRLSQAALGLVGGPRKPPGLHQIGETPPPSRPHSEVAGEEAKSKAAVSKGPPGKPPAAAGGAPLRPPAPMVPARGRFAGSDSGRSVRSESCGPPRVFPTQLVVWDDAGQERWRSSVHLLGEHVRAVQLLQGDKFRAFDVPKDIADSLQEQAHVLNVLDISSGEVLQVADVTGTTILNLQRHCGSDGELTIVIAPLEDSEDAFETVAGPG